MYSKYDMEFQIQSYASYRLQVLLFSAYATIWSNESMFRTLCWALYWGKIETLMEKKPKINTLGCNTRGLKTTEQTTTRPVAPAGELKKYETIKPKNQSVRV